MITKSATYKVLLFAIVFALTGKISNAQNWSCYIANDQFTSPTVFEFDVYLKQTSGADSLFRTFQGCFTFNSAFINGASITASYVGSSTQMTNYTPGTITWSAAGFGFQVASNTGQSCATGTTMPGSGTAKRVGTYRLTATSGAFGCAAPNPNMVINGDPSPSGLALKMGISKYNDITCAVTTSSNLATANVSYTRFATLNEYTLVNNPVRLITASAVTTPSCDEGGGSASSSFTPPGFAGEAITYIWSNSETTQNIGDYDGTYTVTITNANGCTASVSAVIGTGNVIVSIISTPTCINNTGTATASATPAGATYNYSWSNSETTSTISNLSQGVTYTVYVEDQYNCSATASVTIGIDTFTAAVTTTPTCASAGSATATPSGAYYSWSTGATTQTISGLSPGPYSVFITNLSGCSGSAAGTVISSTLTPLVNIGGASTICFNDAATFFAIPTFGGAVPLYQWYLNNIPIAGATTSTISFPQITPFVTNSLVNGDVIKVRMTSNDPCAVPTIAFSNPVTITVNALPTPVLTTNSPICVGNNLQLNASGGTSYYWSGPNGFNSQTANPVINSATTLATGNYIVTVTGSGGCTATSSVSVSVDNIPIPFPGSNTPVCEGKPIHFTSFNGATYLWSGPNGYVDSVQNPTIASALPINSGIYTVIAYAAGGCSASATTTVVVNSKPVVTIGANTPVCKGHTLNLTSSGGPIFYWTGPNFTSTLASPTVASFAANNVGIYIVRVTSSHSCTATNSVLVNINNGPAMTTSYNNPVCIGTPLQLNSSGANSYSWTGPSSFTSNLQNPGIAVTTAANTGNYIVTGADATGCTSTTTINVQIRSKPTPNAGSNFSVCLGKNATFHGSGGTTYSWTGPNGFTSTLQNPIITAVTAGAAGQYFLTVTNTYGCTSAAPATVTLTVNPLPVITLGATGPLCVGNNVTLSASGGTSYSWTGPHGFTSSSANPVISHASAVNSGYYFVNSSNGTCSSRDSINVIINPLPVITATVNSPACVGTLVQFNVAAGQSFSWTGPNNFQSAIQNPAIQQAAFTDTGVYVVSVTDVNGCIDDTSVSVQVVTSPTIAATNNGPFCEGDSLLFTASGADSYLWAGPNGFSSTLQNPVINNVSLPAAGIYTVTGTLLGGCSSAANDTVIVNPNPVVTATNNSPFCEGGTLNFTATGGNTYLWADSTGFTSTDQNPFIQTTTLADSGLYIVIGSDSLTGCSSFDTTYVIILENPNVNLGNDTTLCESTITLNAGNPGAVYLWNDSTANADLFVDSSGIYSVMVTGTNGCISNDSIQVTVNPIPFVSLLLSFDSVCVTAGIKLLDGESPQNGIFIGSGVFGNNFFPDSAFIGWNVITYIFTDSITECSNTAVDSIFVDPCAGIEELSNNSYYSVYPNPFNSTLTIENYQSKGKIKVELMTVDARLIRSWNFYGEQKYMLPLSDIAAGVYFLMMKSDDHTGFFRVVKQ